MLDIRKQIWMMLTLVLVGALNAVGDSDFPLHGRISYDTGTLIKGARDDDWSRATLNTLVLEGDTIWVDKGSNTEIELPGGVFLRMADASKARISQLSPDIVIQGIVGSFYVERIARSSVGVSFVTPACRISFDPETCTRIDIGEGGATQISTRWGRAYVTTDRGGNEMVVGGRQCWVDVGYLPSETVSFALDKMDAFDRWNKSRSELLSEPVRTPPKYVEVRSTTIGYVDLNYYGEWVLIKERYYWRPTVVVDYVPYRVGYWVYEPVIGSVWIETYPFGYITTHYGRWVYYDTYGWVWAFDPVWSPAWVATVRCGDYFIWTPVDFYCRPVVVGASVSFTVGGLNFYVGACSYAPVTYVYTCPWYVAPVPVTVVNYIVTNPVNIYVWNIDCRPTPVIRVPYTTSLPLVRDYNPPRAIRGVPYYNYTRADGAVLASARVRELESSYSFRSSAGGFRSSAGVGSRVMRTTLNQDISNRFRSVRLENTSPKPELVRFDRSAGSFERARGDAIRGGRNIERFSVDTAYTKAIERAGSEFRKDSIGSAVDRNRGVRTDVLSSVRNDNLNRDINREINKKPEYVPNSVRAGVDKGSDIVRRESVRTNPSLPSDTSRTEIGRVDRRVDSIIKDIGSEPSVRTPLKDTPYTPRSLSRIDMDGEQKPRSSSGSRGYDTKRPGSDSGSSGSGSSIRTTPTPTRPTPSPTPSPKPGSSIRTTPRNQVFDNPSSMGDRFSPLNTLRENHSIRTIPSIPTNKVETTPSISNRGGIGGLSTPFGRTPSSSSYSVPSTPSINREGFGRGGASSLPSIGNFNVETPRFSTPRVETPSSFATPSSSVGRSLSPAPTNSVGNSISSGIRGRIR